MLGEFTAFPQTRASVLNFCPLGLRSPPKRHGFGELSKLLQRFRFIEKVEKHCLTSYNTFSIFSHDAERTVETMQQNYTTAF